MRPAAHRQILKRFFLPFIRLTEFRAFFVLAWDFFNSHLSHDVWRLYTKFTGDSPCGIFLLNMFTAYSLFYI